MAARPWYSYGSGGMVSPASLVSRVSTASMSPPSTAAAKRAPARARAGGVRQRGPVAAGREPGLQSRPGALQGAFDRGFCGAEHVGCFGGAVTEHIAEHQDGALAGRQVLQGGDERQLDRLLGVEAEIGRAHV